jgi:hypothetical protein
MAHGHLGLMGLPQTFEDVSMKYDIKRGVVGIINFLKKLYIGTTYMDYGDSTLMFIIWLWRYYRAKMPQAVDVS